MSKKLTRILLDREGLALPETQISAAGYLNISARIARIGIQTYYGHELILVDGVEPDQLYRVYRAPEEVFADEALDSFRDLPITYGHPDAGVSADNYREQAVGHIIGISVRDGDYLRAELSIRDAKTIQRIKAGEGTQISVGYFADVTLKNGQTPAGEPYDAVQSNIRGNHIALVDQARCGPACSVGCICQTQISNTHDKGRDMPKLKDMVLLDGENLPLGEAVEKLKDANSRMAAALKDAQDTIAQLSGELESTKGEVEALQQTPTEDADFTKRVQARAHMLAQAGAILGDSQLTTLTDSDIRRRVINHIYGDGFAEGASEHALIGMYKVAIRDSAMANDTLNGAIDANVSQSDLKTALARRNQRLSSAWKKGA